TRDMTTGPGHIVHLTADLPEGATVSDVAAAFAVLFARHEILRTTYVTGGEPAQRVAAAGELPIDIYEYPGDDWPESHGGVLWFLAKRLKRKGFDIAVDLP